MKIIVNLLVIFIASLMDASFINASIIHAKPIQSNFKGLTLNANFINNEDKSKPVFLLVHGTWATHKMELQSYLQTLLEEEDYASLAITLSLGKDNRSRPQDCNDTIIAGQNDNLDEMGHWVDFLKEKEFTRIVFVAHSKGGAQVASFNKLYPDKSINAQVLIAPQVFAPSKIPESAINLASTSKKDIIGPVQVLYCQDAKVRLQAYQSYYLAQPEKNTPTIISDTKMQTIVFLGSEDKLITEQFLTQSNLYESNKNITINRIDGAGHFFRDIYADEIVEQIIEQLFESLK